MAAGYWTNQRQTYGVLSQLRWGTAFRFSLASREIQAGCIRHQRREARGVAPKPIQRMWRVRPPLLDGGSHAAAAGVCPRNAVQAVVRSAAGTNTRGSLCGKMPRSTYSLLIAPRQGQRRCRWTYEETELRAPAPSTAATCRRSASSGAPLSRNAIVRAAGLLGQVRSPEGLAKTLARLQARSGS